MKLLIPNRWQNIQHRWLVILFYFFKKYAGIKTHQPLFVKPGPCGCSVSVHWFDCKIYSLLLLRSSFWQRCSIPSGIWVTSIGWEEGDVKRYSGHQENWILKPTPLLSSAGWAEKNACEKLEGKQRSLLSSENSRYL